MKEHRLNAPVKTYGSNAFFGITLRLKEDLKMMHVKADDKSRWGAPKLIFYRMTGFVISIVE